MHSMCSSHKHKPPARCIFHSFATVSSPSCRCRCASYIAHGRHAACSWSSWLESRPRMSTAVQSRCTHSTAEGDTCTRAACLSKCAPLRGTCCTPSPLTAPPPLSLHRPRRCHTPSTWMSKRFPAEYRMAKLTLVGPLFIFCTYRGHLTSESVPLHERKRGSHVHKPSLFSCILRPLLVRNIHPRLVAGTCTSHLNDLLFVLTPLMSTIFLCWSNRVSRSVAALAFVLTCPMSSVWPRCLRRTPPHRSVMTSSGSVLRANTELSGRQIWEESNSRFAKLHDDLDLAIQWPDDVGGCLWERVLHQWHAHVVMAEPVKCRP